MKGKVQAYTQNYIMTPCVAWIHVFNSLDQPGFQLNGCWLNSTDWWLCGGSCTPRRRSRKTFSKEIPTATGNQQLKPQLDGVMRDHAGSSKRVRSESRSSFITYQLLLRHQLRIRCFYVWWYCVLSTLY